MRQRQTFPEDEGRPGEVGDLGYRQSPSLEAVVVQTLVSTGKAVVRGQSCLPGTTLGLGIGWAGLGMRGAHLRGLHLYLQAPQTPGAF